MSDQSIKHLAQALRRARVPIKRSKSRRLADAMRKQSTGDTDPIGTPDFLHGEMLDSWEPRYRDQPETRKELPEKETPTKVPEILKTEESEDPDYVVTTRTAKRQKRQKTRNMSVTVSVSEEEAALLRQYAAQLGVGFSAWARGTLFRAMGRKPPARPKKDY